jgi:hypothetical protein
MKRKREPGLSPDSHCVHFAAEAAPPDYESGDLSRQITSRRNPTPGRTLIVLDYYGPGRDHHLCSGRGRGPGQAPANHPGSVAVVPDLGS